MPKRSLAAALVTAMALGAPHVSAAPRELRWSGSGCQEVQVIVAVPEAQARAFVPEPFELDAAGGAVEVLVGFVSCERIQMGRRNAPGMVSEVGIAIRSPDGSAGNHVYSLWQVNDRRDLRSAFARLGMAGGRAPMSFDVTEIAGPTLTIASSIGWKRSSYSIWVAGAEPRFIGSGASVWWHAGSKGIYRIDYSLPSVEAAPSPGVLEAEPGSPLAELIGTDSVPATALFYRFPFSASARRVEL